MSKQSAGLFAALKRPITGAKVEDEFKKSIFPGQNLGDDTDKKA